LVSGFALDDGRIPAASQLNHSLITYMKSSSFEPYQTIEMEKLNEMFTSMDQSGKANVSGGSDNSVLNVKAAGGLRTKNKSREWNKKFDNIISKENGTDYRVLCDGIWKDQNGSSWYGKEIQIIIDCKDGILGELYVHFHDWDNQNRAGILEFEGRKTKIEDQTGEGKWIKFHVMREDSNDGKLIFKANVISGPDLMITQIVLIGE
ncbi:MAG: hypothetical protein KAI29_01890, partial [Cyclobacteriaceae bacterium]|nr:hypothetical protein [Cyclobacteriaceae bacterium]